MEVMQMNEVRQAYFYTISEEYHSKNGQKVTVLRDYKIQDQWMYEIQFEDGTVIEAFENEIFDGEVINA
jgi:hypothetical protein